MPKSLPARRRAPIVPAAVTARNLRRREAIKRGRGRSPNRERLLARAAVWAASVGVAAFWIPHLVG